MLQILVNGYDFTAYYRPKSCSITDLPGGEIGKASFVLENPMYPSPPTMALVHNPMFPVSVAHDMPDPDDYTNLVRYRPDSGHIVAIRDDQDPAGVNIFVGAIIRKPEEPIVRTEDGSYHFVYSVQAASAGYTLDGHTVTDIWEDKQTGFIFADVIESHAPDFDSSSIPTSGDKAGRYRRPQYVAERKPVRQVLDDLAASEGWTWYIEETAPTSLANTKSIRLGPPIYVRESFKFTDDNVDEMCTKPPTIDVGDLSQVRNVIWFDYNSEYATGLNAGAVSGSTNPYDYDKGLARVALNSTNIAPLGNANWASYVKAGAVFYIPGSNYRYTVAQVFDTGNIILSSPILESSGDKPYVFSNIPSTIKLKDMDSINTLKDLFNNGDNGEREFSTKDDRLMRFDQAIQQARAQLSDRANPMVRMTLDTNSYLLRKFTDWNSNELGITGTKVYPKAGKAVEFSLVNRNLQGLFVQKQVVWKDTGAQDVDYRQLWQITLDFNDRLFALTTIFRKLIDGQLNSFGNNSSQVIFDAIDIYERDARLISALNLGGESVTIYGMDNPWMAESIVMTDTMSVQLAKIDMPMAETVLISDAMTFTNVSNNSTFHWSAPAVNAINRAKWGRAQWKNVP
jgi:hypothetical protein